VRLSRPAQRALCGIFDLASNSVAEPCHVRVIGKRQDEPSKALELIFQCLRRAGIAG
jgi:DNA-binding IscR family transcriptional regulator